jgi:hypothetical protein
MSAKKASIMLDIELVQHTTDLALLPVALCVLLAVVPCVLLPLASVLSKLSISVQQ